MTSERYILLVLMKTAMHSRHRGSWLATCVLLAGGSGERWSDLYGPSSAWRPDSGLYHTIKDLQSDKFTCGLVLVEEPVLLIWLLSVLVIHFFFFNFFFFYLVCRVFGFCVCVHKEAVRLCTIAVIHHYNLHFKLLVANFHFVIKQIVKKN